MSDGCFHFKSATEAQEAAEELEEVLEIETDGEKLLDKPRTLKDRQAAALPLFDCSRPAPRIVSCDERESVSEGAVRKKHVHQPTPTSSA